MNNLVEHILDEEYVSAKNIFESRLDEILEKKLYEMKRMVQAESLGGLSKTDIKTRVDAGFVRASDPIEKGGLGLSDFDISQEKIKKRLKSRKSTKKLEEMRAPGEVPGSDSRKQDAEKLRAVRKGLKAYTSKTDVKKYNKAYLSGRKAGMSTNNSIDQSKKPEEMSPELRRANLDKARQRKIDSLKNTDPKAAKRLMNPKDALKFNYQRTKSTFGPAVSGIISGLASLNTMEE